MAGPSPARFVNPTFAPVLAFCAVDGVKQNQLLLGGLFPTSGRIAGAIRESVSRIAVEYVRHSLILLL